MGGFADVFLYEQQMPRRSVAVKVLLASALGDDVRRRFRAEADLMARLSHHPSIVTIYQADVAADGRPYLVMEYCSRPGLGQRYRTERMGVAEVLRIGIRLASAVETAHRAGILHRDIKPANVLVTDFGWPALTDFGIAATTGWSSHAAVGMSIPWSPPELLAEEPVGDVRSDVYSLAATIYSLLARRSPFEVPDGSNTAADLIARIERVPLSGTGRPDVPDSLQALLERAMDRDPRHRHPTALALARALQHVETELLLPVTSLDLPEDEDDVIGSGGTADGEGEQDQATRLRPVQSVSPDAPATRTPAPSAAAGVAVLDEVVERSGDGVPEVWRQHARTITGQESDGEQAEPRSRGRVVAAWVAGLVLVAAIAVGAVLALRQPPAAPPDSRPTATESAPVLRAVPAPTDLVGTVGADGNAVFTWSNPDPQDGDRYLWGVVVAGDAPRLAAVDGPTVSVPPAVAGQQVCIQVAIVRSDGRYSTAPAVGCTPS
jgi:serine/threonine protein kinase